MFRLRKQFKFEAAHMLQAAFTAACWQCVHGHSYVVELFVCAEKLNENDMVIDFGEMKEFCQQIYEEWDHAVLLHEDQRANFIELEQKSVLQKVVYLPQSPTAEYMALYIYRNFVRYLQTLNDAKGDDLKNIPFVQKVRVHETVTGWAEYGQDR